jgi:hypothetical protein
VRVFFAVHLKPDIPSNSRYPTKVVEEWLVHNGGQSPEVLWDNIYTTKSGTVTCLAALQDVGKQCAFHEIAEGTE